MSPDKPSASYVVLYAAITSSLFTAAITTFHVATADIVKRNERLLEDKALVEIFFGRGKLNELLNVSQQKVTEFVEQRIVRDSITDPETSEDMTLLIAYGSDKVPDAPRSPEDIVGYGFSISGVGFWARIDGVLATSQNLSTIKGVYFLRHSETPGLGGRITEDKFRMSFVGLDMTQPAAGSKFIYIGGDKPTGPGSPKYDRHVDAITGATGTSRAVERFVNEDIARFRRAMIAAGKIKQVR